MSKATLFAVVLDRGGVIDFLPAKAARDLMIAGEARAANARDLQIAGVDMPDGADFVPPTGGEPAPDEPAE